MARPLSSTPSAATSAVYIVGRIACGAQRTVRLLWFCQGFAAAARPAAGPQRCCSTADETRPCPSSRVAMRIRSPSPCHLGSWLLDEAFRLPLLRDRSSHLFPERPHSPVQLGVQDCKPSNGISPLSIMPRMPGHTLTAFRCDACIQLVLRWADAAGDSLVNAKPRFTTCGTTQRISVSKMLPADT